MIIWTNQYLFLSLHPIFHSKYFITSWSAKPVSNVTLEMYIPEVDEYIPVAFIESIPAFSRFSFKPSFVGRRNIWKKKNGNFVSFTCPYLDLNRMKTRLVSDDEHFKMLQKIDARWTCSFSNYVWTPEYRDCGINDTFKDDAKLQKTIEDFYKKSRLVKYFTENPIKDHAK